MPSQRVSPPSTLIPLQARNTLPPPHAFGMDARCVACKVLKHAIRHILTQAGKRQRSTSSDEFSELIALVASAIHQAWCSALPAVPVRPKVDPRIHSSLGRRLLELLRSDVVEGWHDFDVADGALLPLLVAMERVRVTIQPNWTQTFAQQLSGSDGLALLMDVAHDLRSPLTSILVLAETLQRGQSGDVNDVQRRQLGLIYTAALGLSSVASDIIEFTQGGDQLVEQEPSAFSITAMLESVHDIVRPIAEEKRLKMRLLAPTTDERLGHPVALSRILLNLTTNALKFTDEGYVEIIAQEIAGNRNRVEFAVRDSGRGIPTDKITTLFQPLRKESGRRGQLFSQTGLGLTICRKLATAMKSELKVESRIGWGTRFYFEIDLPIAPARRSGPRAAPRPATHPVRNSGSHTPRPSAPHSNGSPGPRTSGPQRRTP
ncbi:MAG TPA: HAMP domain-containing sensor histidine kinase [Gemmatimonadales bacterium]|nr:HAMP domain-containing sensor histidine kinase [Gemmatimonadales bacterium]